tara:strand:- start:776 stop:1693 length:918 start_codon:yes stop_codon:yes gene_type:complete
MTDKKMPKNATEYFCEKCVFRCSKKSNYDKHLSTRKHKILTNTYKKMPKNATAFMCLCGKSYKHRQSMHTHQKKCKFENFEKFEKKTENFEKKTENFEKKTENLEISKNSTEDLDFKQMFMVAMQKNDELTGIIKEMVPNIGNNNNNKVNINLFLNENCKDALNIMDFVNTLNLQLKDLENTGRLGYTDGITQIFKDGLNNLELTKRPIHCDDKTTFYVKDNDVWDTDTHNQSKFKKAIEHVGKNNFKQIQDWVHENPECGEAGTYKNNEYMKIVENNVNKKSCEMDQIIENLKVDISIETAAND